MDNENRPADDEDDNGGSVGGDGIGDEHVDEKDEDGDGMRIWP